MKQFDLNSRTFRFPPELEQSFQEHYRATTIFATRLALVVAIVLYAAFGALDWIAMPLSRGVAWVIRYAIVCPIFGFVLLVTFLPFFRKHLQIIMGFGIASAGLGIVAMIAVSRETELGYWYYMSGLLLVVMAAYGLTRLRFWPAVAATLVIVVADEIVDLGLKQALGSSDGVTLFVLHNFFLLGATVIGMFTGYALEAHARREYLQKRTIEIEREKSEALLLNVLPERIAAQLKQRNHTIADEFHNTSVLFADIADFTPLVAQLSPRTVVTLLNELFSLFDGLVDCYRVEKIKTVGDCYMVGAGVPEHRSDHARVIASLALDMLECVRQRRFLDSVQLGLRIGIHSGPLVAGVVGSKKFAYDLWGDTVNTASRMESHGAVGKIQITQTTYELLREDFECEAVGEIPVKGKGRMKVWYLLGSRKAGPVGSASGTTTASLTATSCPLSGGTHPGVGLEPTIPARRD